MSEFSMFPVRAWKEIDFDAASDSTASDKLQASHSGEASTPSESDVDVTADNLSPAGSVGRFVGQCKQPVQVPPPAPWVGLGRGGVDIYSSPPPGLHPISANAHVARPPPGLERAKEAPPSTGMPAPPPELPPASLFSAPVIPEVPVWAAAGASELASKPLPLKPLPWNANMSSIGNGQPLNPGCENLFPFTNPVPGWSTCVASDKFDNDDVSLKIRDFAKHHVRENSPDRKKRNLDLNGALQSRNSESCWQQVPQIPQVGTFNGLEQNAGGNYGAPMTMWNNCEGWLQDPNSNHDSNLSQPPNSNGTFCLAQQLSTAYNSDPYNSDMYQEHYLHNSLGHSQELYPGDAFQHHRHHVDHQFTEFMGDQNCALNHAWNMQTSSRQDSTWAPAFFGPGSNEFY